MSESDPGVPGTDADDAASPAGEETTPRRPDRASRAAGDRGGRWWRRPPVMACALVALLVAAGGGTVLLVHSRADSTGAGGSAAAAASSCPTLGADHPIATVRGTPLLSSVFDGRLCVTLRAALQSGQPDAGPAFIASLRGTVLKSYVFDTVIAQEARIHNVVATQQQIDAEIAAQVEASGGQSQLDKQLADAGGSRTTLVDATRSHLVEAALVDQLARERAALVVTELQGGLPFDQAARQFSDDVGTRDAGGALGRVTLDLLKGADPTFQAAVLSMKPGELTTTPIHDNGGYEVVYMDAADATTRTLHVIRIAAPQPYRVQERPNWFAEFIFLDIQANCEQQQITVIEQGLRSPCAPATPAASAAATPSATGGGPTPAPPSPPRATAAP